MSYTIRNCPACEDIINYEINEKGDFIETGIDTPDYCVRYKKSCDKVSDCLMKQIYTIANEANYIDDRDAIANILDKFEVENEKR